MEQVIYSKQGDRYKVLLEELIYESENKIRV